LLAWLAAATVFTQITLSGPIDCQRSDEPPLQSSTQMTVVLGLTHATRLLWFQLVKPT